LTQAAQQLSAAQFGVVLSRIQRVPRVADFFHLEDCLKISSERLAFPAGRVAAPDG
jgi:hypothetical protein